MIDHVHPIARLTITKSRRTIDRARKAAVCGVEGRLPQLAELVEDVRNGTLVGFVVHEDDGSSVM